MKNAIVIGCHVNGLGAIRSLALQKFRIVAMTYDPASDFAHVSRHVAQRVRVPHPRADETAFIEILMRKAQRWPGALLIDTNDDVSIALSKNRSVLQELYAVPTPEWSVLQTLIDKPSTYRIASECGVAHPRTLLPKSSEDLDRIRSDIVFPCILKPVQGHLFFAKFHHKNFLVGTFAELRSKFQLCADAGCEVMIQEIIPGPDSNLYQCMVYVDSAGTVSSPFITRKIRQNPPQFGVARVACSHGPIPELANATERMLNHIGFRGIAHSEFKKDPRDGTFKLMEINGRLCRSNWLSAHCGVNFPWMAYQDLAQHTRVPAREYDIDVHWIELAEDVANSIAFRKREDFALSEYLQPYSAARKTFADISADDIGPFLKRALNVATQRWFK